MLPRAFEKRKLTCQLSQSTLVETLKKNLDFVVFVDEPVDEWTQVVDNEGQTILQKYYADQKRYAFAFQVRSFTASLRLRLLTFRVADDGVHHSGHSITKSFGGKP